MTDFYDKVSPTRRRLYSFNHIIQIVFIIKFLIMEESARKIHLYHKSL